MSNAPDYEELADALRCLAYAYGARTVKDGLNYIGLHHGSTQYIRSKPYHTSEAYEVLARLEDRIGEASRAENLRKMGKQQKDHSDVH